MTSGKMESMAVYRGSPPNNAFVWSPFATKLEARLRFDNISYRLGAGSPRTAPRGKIPYIEVYTADSTTPDRVGDSTLVIRQLVENGILADLNARLTPAQRATDLAIRAMMEDKVYFYGTREKWCDNHVAMRSGALAAVPWPMRVVVGWLAWRNVSSTLWGQGTGRLSADEVLMLKEEVWEGVDALLQEGKRAAGGSGKEPFWVLGGRQPTEADATVFGFVTGALVCYAAPVTQDIVRRYPTVVEYAERIHQTYFPDYQRWD